MKVHEMKTLLEGFDSYEGWFEEYENWEVGTALSQACISGLADLCEYLHLSTDWLGDWYDLDTDYWTGQAVDFKYERVIPGVLRELEKRAKDA